MIDMSSDFRVYLLENKSGKRHVGISGDLGARLVQHNEGKSRWTAKYRPWKLIWQSRATTLSEARKLENLMKRQKGGSGLSRILDEFRDDGS